MSSTPNSDVSSGGDTNTSSPNGNKGNLHMHEQMYCIITVHSDAFLTISVKRQVFISVLKVEITKWF